MKMKVKIKTQNDKIVETQLGIYGTKYMKKLSESGKNSAT